MTVSSAPDQARPFWHPEFKPAALLIPPVTAVAAVAALLLWQAPRLFAIGTNNAYVRGNVTQIAAEVSGRITQVQVSDYETVVAGAILARVDDRVPLAQRSEAEAALERATAALANNDQAALSAQAVLAGRIAGLTAARAQLVLMQADAARAENLVARNAVPVRSGDVALAALGSAEAAVDQALAEVEIAGQKIAEVGIVRSELEAEVAIAVARLDAAQARLADTTIRAPVAGQLGEVGVRVGQYVVPGSSLMPPVPETRWVIANFKEGQIAGLSIGQRVSIRIDVLGGLRLAGRIARISPAAGSEFSVLKPDNATGNFVKVPQRIGVRIAFDPDQAEVARLGPGMSATVTIEDGP
jgi:multidrug resistance efflux pump